MFWEKHKPVIVPEFTPSEDPFTIKQSPGRSINDRLDDWDPEYDTLNIVPRIKRLENIVQQMLLLEGLKAEEVPEKIIHAHVILTPIPRKEKPTTNV